jgi:hypothetical protein
MIMHRITEVIGRWAVGVGALALLPLSLAGQTPPAEPQVYYACYTPLVGLVYRIKGPNLPSACLARTHVLFSWTDGLGAIRTGTPAGGDLSGAYPNPLVVGLRGHQIDTTGALEGQVLRFDVASGTWKPATLGEGGGTSDHGQLTGLLDDDHPQYVLANGVRSVSSGFAVEFNGTQGAIPASGEGGRMMWFASRRAFRAGQVLGTEWDDANIGQGSIAMGQFTIASGPASTALGAGTKASASASTALGDNTISSGRSSLAAGELSTASGDFSTALGTQAQAIGVAALASGIHLTASGPASTALGNNSTASGSAATAMGTFTTASGGNSTAMGTRTTASGDYSTAMGQNTVASGYASTAMGWQATASGNISTAMGLLATASGERSTAIGTNASTNGFQGSFVYGDNSTADIVAAAEQNEFVVRAAGGFRLRTSADLSTGCNLPAGSGDWSCTSSRFLKTDFETLDGETVLARVRELPVELWSYKTERGVRHLGTFAEDLHRVFGLGTSTTSIGMVDMDGVNLAAVKALEQRTRSLQDQLDAKDRQIADLRERLERMERLEAARP